MPPKLEQNTLMKDSQEIENMAMIEKNSYNDAMNSFSGVKFVNILDETINESFNDIDDEKGYISNPESEIFSPIFNNFQSASILSDGYSGSNRLAGPLLNYYAMGSFSNKSWKNISNNSSLRNVNNNKSSNETEVELNKLRIELQHQMANENNLVEKLQKLQTEHEMEMQEMQLRIKNELQTIVEIDIKKKLKKEKLESKNHKKRNRELIVKLKECTKEKRIAKLNLEEVKRDFNELYLKYERECKNANASTFLGKLRCLC